MDKKTEALLALAQRIEEADGELISIDVKAAAAIREVLVEQPVQQELASASVEPVACVHIKDGCLVGSHRDGSKLFPDGQYGLWPIDNSPAQRTWVGLTDEEIGALLDPFPKYASEWGYGDFYQFARAIEAKLKAKNNG